MTMDALVNNAAPTDIGFAGSVSEDAAPGTVVGTATATDGQTEGGDTVTFSLSDDAGMRFAIDATTGVVTLVGALLRPLRSSSFALGPTSRSGSSPGLTGVTRQPDFDPASTGSRSSQPVCFGWYARGFG